MEIKTYFAKKKEFYDKLLRFLEDYEINNADLEIIFKNIKIDLTNDKEEMIHLLQLLTSISNNHHRYRNFNDKVKQIFEFFKEEIKQTLSNLELFDIIKSNKILLIFLFEKRILTIDSYITKELKNKQEPNGIKYSDFFIPELKMYSKEEEEDEIMKNYENYYENRLLGENDSYICNLIRQDSVVEFISYINRYSIPISSTIKRSIFETNSYLNEHDPTLIEYAAFYGSIQIFQYLKLNNVRMEPNLWFYVIHSKNPELIHILEENEIKPPNEDYLVCLEESIKCHHNDIAEYIKDNLIKESSILNNNESFVDCVFQNSNYSFYQGVKLNEKDLFFYFCFYDYYKVVNFCLKIKDEYIK